MKRKQHRQRPNQKCKRQRKRTATGQSDGTKPVWRADMHGYAGMSLAAGLGLAAVMRATHTEHTTEEDQQDD